MRDLLPAGDDRCPTSYGGNGPLRPRAAGMRPSCLPGKARPGPGAPSRTCRGTSPCPAACPRLRGHGHLSARLLRPLARAAAARVTALPAGKRHALRSPPVIPDHRPALPGADCAALAGGCPLWACLSAQSIRPAGPVPRTVAAATNFQARKPAKSACLGTAILSSLPPDRRTRLHAPSQTVIGVVLWSCFPFWDWRTPQYCWPCFPCWARWCFPCST